MVSLDLIQINYSELDNITNRFVQQADTNVWTSIFR